MLNIGQDAPPFEMLDEQGNNVRLADFKDRSAVVLMFYPADETPGCTKQMCAARDDYDRYQAAGVQVFGVNPANAERHKKFVAKHGLRTPLLVDEGAKTAKTYDALMPIPVLNIVNRTVVGIDRNGKIAFYKRGMPSTSEILGAMTSSSVNA
jgi:peroxiredoxin Q/BCP